MNEKHLPQNIEAEECLLGSLIIDPEALSQVEDMVRPNDFYRDAHRTLYQAMLTLAARREPCDLVMLCNELQRAGTLANVGGASAILSFTSTVPTSANVVSYARIVAQKALYRRLIHAAGQMAALAYEECENALEEAERLLFTLGETQAAEITPLVSVLSDCLNTLDALHERRATITGIPTGYRHLDAPLGGLQRSDLVILAARPGTGKCLTAHTLLDIPGTGERKTLEACIQQREPLVYGLSEEGVIRPALVSQWIDSGLQPCYRVRTRLGREVEVTGHHPFLTVHGWKPLHDIPLGHHIAVPAKVACFGEDERWPLEKVRLLAYFIAEGGLTSTYPLFTNTDPVIIEDFQQIIATHFPQCAVKQYDSSDAVAQPRNATTMRGGAILPKNPVTVWLEELGLMGKSAKEKFFPPCVWKWSRRYLAEFLKVLMSCDGSIFPGSKGQPIIQFTVASAQLAKDVSHAFLRFGIVGKYSCTSRGAFRIDVTANEGVRTYQEEIGWIGEKHARFVNYAYSFHHGYRGHVPCEIWSLVSASAQRKSLALVGLASLAGERTASRTSGYNPQRKRPLPRYRLAAYAQVLDDNNRRRASRPDVYWDEIVSIEPIGEQQVYDLTVPDGANFIANDVFVHNTSFAVNAARHACQVGYHVLLFSLEMSRQQLGMRLLSMEAGIDQHRLRLGRVEDDEWDQVVAALGTLSELPLWMDDTAALPLASLCSRARRMQAQEGIDLIIVDYLQLMRVIGEGKRAQNREQEIAEISRGLKALAKELQVPVLALAQLSRAVETRASKVPQLSDLRESGALENDADVVLFIYRDELYTPESEAAGTADLIIAKHRNGPTGTIRLGFDPTQTRFYTLDKAAGGGDL